MLRMLQLLALDQHRCRCAVAALCACVRVPRLSVCSFSRATGRFRVCDIFGRSDSNFGLGRGLLLEIRAEQCEA